jgi:amino acid permease
MVGFALGTILIMIGALAGAWSLRNVLYCAEIKKSVSYTSMVRKIAGSKLDRIMTILIIISISGTCISE